MQETINTFYRLLIAFLFVCALVLALAGPVKAQSYSRDFEAIAELNRANPRQSTAYDQVDQVLGRRILDRKNRVIGEVREVILKDNGNISQLYVEFDRMRLGGEVYLNYRDMRIKPVTNGYALGFEADQVETLYPSLLSNIETAAGSEDTFSVRNLMGADVKAEDGRKIGKVDDILFGSRGSRAEALYVALRAGNMRGKYVAIPFSMAEFKNERGRKVVVFSDKQADAIIDYAKSR